MATTKNTESHRIDGQGKQILVLEQEDYSALSALLYELADEAKLREISAKHKLALGSNHLESLPWLWQKLNS